MRWKWVDGEDWRVDGAEEKDGKSRKQELKDKVGGDGAKDEGWIYYDNKVCCSICH